MSVVHPEPEFEGKPLSYWLGWRADQQRYLDAAIAKGSKGAITRWSRGIAWITPHIDLMQVEVYVAIRDAPDTPETLAMEKRIGDLMKQYGDSDSELPS